MLLYWGMFTFGFSIGAIFSFITFASKDPEENLPEVNVRKPKVQTLSEIEKMAGLVKTARNL